jgi:hypothetical protein
MDRQSTCSVCGATRDNAEVCPTCGSRDKQTELESMQTKASGGPLGTVNDSPASPNRPHSIAVRTPLSANSEAHLRSDGSVSFVASGRPDVGAPGEPYVRDILMQRLTADGSNVILLPGASDSRGEDALLQVDGRCFTLQVTSVPADSAYWCAAAQRSARTDADINGAVQWLREAIVRKSSVDDRPGTILAIDARHAGVLADSAIADAYRTRYGSPTSEFRFAQVWIVGPTETHCTRLYGRPGEAGPQNLMFVADSLADTDYDCPEPKHPSGS